MTDIPRLLAAAAAKYALPPDILSKVARTESGLDQSAISKVGAVGVMQLMPGTAKELGVDAHDVAQNIDGGAKYLRQQFDRFGTWPLALAAYNAGPGKVQTAKGVPDIPETKKYVSKILGGPGLAQPTSGADIFGLDRAGSAGGQSGADIFDSPTAAAAPAAKPAGKLADPATGELPTREEMSSLAYGPAYDRARKMVQDTAQTAGRDKGNRFLDQVVASTGAADEVAGGVNYARQAVVNLVRQSQGRPVTTPAGTAYKAASDFERSASERYAREHPMLDKVAAALGFLTAGRPVAGAPILANPIKAGAQAAAANAPFALARQEGDAGDRLPGALTEEAAVAATGGALQAGANGLSRLAAGRPVRPVQPSRLAESVARFEAAGVRPSLAAVGGEGTSRLAKVAAENPIAGVTTRGNLRASLADTAQAAGSLSQRYGSALPPASIGDRVQEAVTHYSRGTGAQLPPDLARSLSSRATTFGDKATALYTRAERLVGTPDAPVPMTNTMAALTATLGHFQNAGMARRYANPEVFGLAQDIAQANGQLPWSDVAKLRTVVRERLMADPALRGTVSDAQVNRIYDGISQDLQAGAARHGGPEAARAWSQANQFYRAGRARMDTALEKVFGAPSGESVYGLIERSGGSTSAADIGRLTALKRSVPPDHWGDIAATMVNRLGAPTAGASDALEPGAFSVSRFVTNYAKLSPQGRQVLFGSAAGGGRNASELGAALDNLAQVAGMQKGVEAAANRSNSAAAAQAGATVVGLFNPHSTVPTLGALAGLHVTGEAMTNPAFVRWLAQAAQMKGQGAPLAQHMARLQAIAAKDPQVGAVYERLMEMGGKAAPGEAPVSIEGPAPRPKSLVMQ